MLLKYSLLGITTRYLLLFLSFLSKLRVFLIFDLNSFDAFHNYHKLKYGCIHALFLKIDLI
nr:MAG TPA: hypothetical protein [Caudoviricetes sp.]